MKKISEYNTSRDLSMNKAPSMNVSPSRRMMTVFEIFRRRYGRLWVAVAGQSERALSQTMLEWQTRLSSLTDAQVRRGLDRWDGQYPPNVEEFKRVCRTAPAHQTFKALPRPKADPGVAQDHIRRMRGKLCNSARKE